MKNFSLRLFNGTYFFAGDNLYNRLFFRRFMKKIFLFQIPGPFIREGNIIHSVPGFFMGASGVDQQEKENCRNEQPALFWFKHYGDTS